MFDILFVDNITTTHFKRFQQMWPENRPTDYPDDPVHKKWWSVFRGFLLGCFTKTRVHMNKYFRACHPGARKGQNWFPRPAKMAPPKPDLGTPPIVIKSVKVAKRKHASCSKSAGKRRSKRARTKRALQTPEDSPADSEDSEEGSVVSEEDSEGSEEDSEVSEEEDSEVSEEDSATSSDEEVRNTPPAAPTPESPEIPQRRPTAVQRTTAGPSTPTRRSSRTSRRCQTKEQSSINTPTVPREPRGDVLSTCPAAPTPESPEIPQRRQTAVQRTTAGPSTTTRRSSRTSRRRQTREQSSINTPTVPRQSEEDEGRESSVTIRAIHESAAPTPPLEIKREEKTPAEHATSPPPSLPPPPAPKPATSGSESRISKLGRNGMQFKQRMPRKQA